jgi:hypothetical protein
MFTSFGLGAAIVHGVHAQSKPPAHVMSEIEAAGPGVYATFVPHARSAAIGSPNIAAAEKATSLFRVIIVVHAISSNWHETFGVDPGYPSIEMCEAASHPTWDGN